MYDLNFEWTPSTTRDEIDRMLRYVQTQGIKTVALSHVIQSPLPKAADIKNPLPKYPSTPHPTQAPSSEVPTPLPPPPPVTVLHRATLVVSDLPPNHYITTLSQHYHLIALRPTTPEAFQAACMTASDRGAPLISLNLAQRLPFLLRGKAVRGAVQRNVRFEVNLAQLVAEFDDGKRANFIANLMQLFDTTNGKGLILSSGASKEFYLGRPVDSVNMLEHMLRDLDVKQRKERLWDGVGEGPRRLVAEEGMRRRSGRGVIEVVQVVAQPKRDSPKNDNQESAGKEQQQQQQQQQQKKGANQQGGGKRKGNWSQKGGAGGSSLPPSKKKRK